MTIDKVCWNIGVLEKERQLKEEIIKEYEKIGCNDCKGYNEECKHYVALYMEKDDNYGTI